MVDKKINFDDQQLFSGFSYKDSFDQQLEISLQKLNLERFEGEENGNQHATKLAIQKQKKQNSIEKELFQLTNKSKFKHMDGKPAQ